MIAKNTVIQVTVHTGFCGQELVVYAKLARDFTAQELDDTVLNMARENAEAYGLYPSDWAFEDEIEANPDKYVDTIDGNWCVVEDLEVINQEIEHWD